MSEAHPQWHPATPHQLRCERAGGQLHEVNVVITCELCGKRTMTAVHADHQFNREFAFKKAAQAALEEFGENCKDADPLPTDPTTLGQLIFLELRQLNERFNNAKKST